MDKLTTGIKNTQDLILHVLTHLILGNNIWMSNNLKFPCRIIILISITIIQQHQLIRSTYGLQTSDFVELDWPFPRLTSCSPEHGQWNWDLKLLVEPRKSAEGRTSQVLQSQRSASHKLIAYVFRCCWMMGHKNKIYRITS